MYPLPIVNPKLPRNRYSALQRMGAFTSAIALILFVLFVPSDGSSRLPLGLLLFGIWFVGFECLLSENSAWWAQTLRGLLGRKGRMS